LLQEEHNTMLGEEHTMTINDQFLGIVQGGRFQILAPEYAAGSAARLTGMQMQEAQPPEAKEIDLTKHEGSVVMVGGHFGGDWIYSAQIVEQAGPILSTVVTRLFAQPAKKEA
jgi:hypothetical protein